ncbi:MAG: HipA N-terminal domain-containing protein [Chlamydiales bacterium]|nr:HipA N-terminal domain-containing protein [Chlamydiales bacterium]
MKHSKNKILAVLIYLERRKSRKFVGTLTYSEKQQVYIFQYDKNYLHSKLIPLGPDLPLNRKNFVSKDLFESFVDRLPSRDNPSYKDYCLAENIDINEQDPFILLTTIGKRGPSSFVFEADYMKTFGAEDVKRFRSELNLTIKEFSLGFMVAEKTLISIEGGKSAGRDVMKRLELYVRFPSVALFEFQRNSAQIHIEKKRFVENILNHKINENTI